MIIAVELNCDAILGKGFQYSERVEKLDRDVHKETTTKAEKDHLDEWQMGRGLGRGLEHLAVLGLALLEPLFCPLAFSDVLEQHPDLPLAVREGVHIVPPAGVVVKALEALSYAGPSDLSEGRWPQNPTSGKNSLIHFPTRSTALNLAWDSQASLTLDIR